MTRWSSLLFVAAAASSCQDSGGAPVRAPLPEQVRFRRIDGPPAPLLDQGNVWDLPVQEPRTRGERFARVGETLVLRENSALALQVPGRALGQLELLLTGDARGAPAKAHLFSLLVPITDVRDVATIPDDMHARIHETLAEITWTPGTKSVTSGLVPGDRATTWFLLSVETGAGGELALDRVRLDDIVPVEVDRHSVGAESRPAVPIPVPTKATRRFELPPLAEGATVELALALPDGHVALRDPVRARLRLQGSRERERVLSFSDGAPAAPGAPVRQWADVVFHVERAERGAALELEVEGPEGAALFVALPVVLPKRDATTPSNLLLVSLDTLRADRVGAWGSTSGATPNLDAFARRSVRFARAYSPANFTTPAHASMMTGLEPFVHGSYRYGERRSIRAWPNLAGACVRAGMTTAAFTGGGLVDSVFGFDKNFHRYRALDPLMTDVNPRYTRSPRKQMPEYNRSLRSGASLADVTRWLEEHGERRFFLFLHTYHVHDYSPAAASARRFGADPDAPWPKPVDVDPATFARIERDSAQLQSYSRTYDASLAETDAAFGRVVATLERAGLLENTVVLVTADHGEAFREHDSLFHANGLHDEVLRVPMLLYAPGVAPAVVDTPVSLVDVAPTLIELARLEPLPDAQGRSLVPLLRGDAGSEGASGFDARPLLSLDCPPDGLTHSALVSGRYKYLRLSRREGEREVVASEHLYDLVEDPGERHDLARDPEHAARLAQAREALDRKLAEVQAAATRAEARRDQAVDLGADLDEELKLLGYIGY